MHTKNVNTLAWNLGGGRLATGSDDKTARVYDVDDSVNLKPVVKLDGETMILMVDDTEWWSS